jgi:hypothetical protein
VSNPNRHLSDAFRAVQLAQLDIFELLSNWDEISKSNAVIEIGQAKRRLAWATATLTALETEMT